MALDQKVDNLKENMSTMAQSIIKMSNEMRDFKDEMSEFKDEMSEFKDEMSEFKDEINMKWGHLSNQLGRVVQNLIIPNIDILIDKYFEETSIESYAEIYKKSTASDKRREFNGLVVTPSYVFLFEVKNQVKAEYIDQFHQFVESNQFYDYFPQYQEKKLIPVMASLSLKPHQITNLTEVGILGVSIKGDILKFENIDQIDL